MVSAVKDGIWVCSCIMHAGASLLWVFCYTGIVICTTDRKDGVLQHEECRLMFEDFLLHAQTSSLKRYRYIRSHSRSGVQAHPTLCMCRLLLALTSSACHTNVREKRVEKLAFLSQPQQDSRKTFPHKPSIHPQRDESLPMPHFPPRRFAALSSVPKSIHTSMISAHSSESSCISMLLSSSCFNIPNIAFAFNGLSHP